MGITGAWFTKNGGSAGGDAVSMTFGTINVTIGSTGTTISNQGKVDGTGSSSPYLLVAGTEIETGVNFTNSSTVDIYYAFVKDGHAYVVDADGENLVELLADGSNLVKLAPEDTTPSISRKYRVAETADAGSLIKSAAFELWNGSAWQSVDLTGVTDFKINNAAANASTAVVYGQTVDFGLALVNGTYKLAAIQADNIAASAVRAALIAVA